MRAWRKKNGNETHIVENKKLKIDTNIHRREININKIKRQASEFKWKNTYYSENENLTIKFLVRKFS